MHQDDLVLRAACRYSLFLHPVVPIRERLQQLAEHPLANEPADFYGTGGAVNLLEQRVAELLGKARAMFFMKGITAQLALLKTLTTQQDGPVAVPALSHIVVDEQDAASLVTGISLIQLGDDGPFDTRHLEQLDILPRACVVELPLRRAAYRLLPLDALREVSRWCCQHHVHLHFDGARLWEAAAGYGISPRDLAGLADSVYVSFYKGLGGLAGAALAGSAALLDEVTPWKTRLGGDVHTSYPVAMAALDGLERYLPKMQGYVERARQLAACLSSSGFRTIPETPDVNAFQVILPADAEHLRQRHREFARRHGIWLFNDFRPSAQPGHAVAEIVIGDAASAHDHHQILGWIGQLLSG